MGWSGGGGRELYCRLDVTVLFFFCSRDTFLCGVGGGASGRVGVERGDQRLSSWMGRPVVKHPASTRAVASTYVRLASGSSIVLQTPLRRTTTSTTPRPWLSLCPLCLAPPATTLPCSLQGPPPSRLVRGLNLVAGVYALAIFFLLTEHSGAAGKEKKIKKQSRLFFLPSQLHPSRMSPEPPSGTRVCFCFFFIY